MDLQDFLQPASGTLKCYNEKNILASCIDFLHEVKNVDFYSYDIFIIGNYEQRTIETSSYSKAPQLIREQLLMLSKVSRHVSILDFGDFKSGKTLADSLVVIREVLSFLQVYNKPIIIMGGAYEMVREIAPYAFKDQEYPCLTTINSRIDTQSTIQGAEEESCLHFLVNNTPALRLNHIAHQTYYTIDSAVEWYEQMYFPYVRLANIKQLKEVEPLLRDSQLIHFCMNAIRFSDNPGVLHPSPTGLHAEQSCQIAWYSGFSDNSKMFFVSDYLPDNDKHNVSALLSAQLLWHFIDGVVQRKNENLNLEEAHNKYYVQNNYIHQNIVFYESKKTGRMWVDVPLNKENLKRIMPCSESEYKRAVANEIPSEWLLEFNRLFSKE